MVPQHFVGLRPALDGLGGRWALGRHVATIHLDTEKDAKAYHKTLKDLGCQSKVHGHDGHFDLTFSCPKWREMASACDKIMIPFNLY